MFGPALSVKTRDLVTRAETGDREACFDLARLLKPHNTEELVLFVRPDGLITTRLFDALADAYNAWREHARAA